MSAKTSSPPEAPRPEGDAQASETPAAHPRVLTPAAERALAEAEARRRARDAEAAAAGKAPTEHGGQAGPDPARYGDWEKNGIASDF